MSGRDVSFGPDFTQVLQDFAQRNLSAIPGYRVIKEEGPDHRKMFQVIVELGGKQYGPSWGANKKEAEQRAARDALKELGLLALEEARPEPSGLGS